ncbi:EGF-like calcium-binding protein [Corchorus olitorius]|uniref:EGF-like calcium-binding protein n=1 Tax=Corchorus olitorius TaxID=93759 RepID=A0A1R3HU35_9ROSI|nr:EGF-like calcium-binding protein [Corchorus olitorius]
MEVLSISLEENESIRVKSPIISTNCSGRESSKGVNLTGSPFFFSETMNKFIAAGCNNKASMTGIIEPNIVGCESACVGDTDTLFGPNNTCKTVIPSFIQVFNAKFKSKDPESESTGCKLAFIAEEKWFQRNLKTESSVLQNMDYVEAVLDWIVPDTDNGFDLPGKDLYRTEYRCTIYSFLGVSSVPNASRCYCQDGFEGNPYLPNGCQDIDECQDDPKRRCGNATCVNRPGHYVCEKAKTWIIILGISLGFGVLCLAIGAWFLCKYLKERRNIKLKKKFFKRNGGLSEGNIEKTEYVNIQQIKHSRNAHIHKDFELKTYSGT